MWIEGNDNSGVFCSFWVDESTGTHSTHYRASVNVRSGLVAVCTMACLCGYNGDQEWYMAIIMSSYIHHPHVCDDTCINKPSGLTVMYTCITIIYDT